VKIASNGERRRTFGSLTAALVLSVLAMTSCGLGSEVTAERVSSTEAGRRVGEPTITTSATNTTTIVKSTTETPTTTTTTTVDPTTTAVTTTTATPTTRVVPTTTTPTTTTTPSSTVATSIEAETAYLRRCGGCHGAAETEQAAQSLAAVASNPASWVRAKVMAGGGGMPAFGEWLDPAEIDAIIAYVTATFP
jgi:hypothetical protein